VGPTDVLARLGIYLISEPSPAFIPLLRPLLTPHSLPETLIVVLLDWSRPWEWVRQIKTWVRLLRGIFTSLDDDCRRTLDDVAQAWESRRSTYADGGGGGGAGAGLGDVALPLGPGEFDEPIGLPLCVVCQNVGLFPRGLKMINEDMCADYSFNATSLIRLRRWSEKGVGRKKSLISFCSSCGLFSSNVRASLTLRQNRQAFS